MDAGLADGNWYQTSDQFPKVATESPWYPPAIFGAGTDSALRQRTVGIVGTRHSTVYGKAVAQKYAEALAAAGVTIVSGGAVGIDTAAHTGALKAGGSTIAVMAGGLDQLYPQQNRALFRQIQEKGCLITQFGYGTRPEPFRFLARNALINCLSEVILVVECPVRSGSLNTVRHALDSGREVFVVPGTIDMETFRGSHKLIKEGASLTDDPKDILEALNVQPQLNLQMASAESTTGMGAKILSVLTVTPLSPEKVSELTGLPPHEVLSELTMLELMGMVIRETGGYALVP